MTGLYESELALLRTALWDVPLLLPSDTDWDALTAELKAQAVSGLVCEVKLPDRAPEEIKKNFAALTLVRGAKFYQYLNAQEELLDILKEADIPVVILKGCAAAVNYPKPYLRNMGDIDFLVPDDIFCDVNSLLHEHGFAVCEEMTPDKKHISLSKGGFEFELHRYFGTIKNQTYRDEMDRQTLDGLRNIVTLQCMGSSFPMFAPLQNGLVLLEHMAQHLSSEGLGLRHIIDWMMYVHKYLTDEFWEAEFKSAAQRLSLEDLAVTASWMCMKYLGLPGEISWCCCKTGEKKDELADDLMEYILSSGNFGRKKGIGGLVEKHLVASKNVLSVFKQMQGSGIYHCEAFEKHKILRPFAWVYGAGRYIHKTFGRKGALSALKSESDNTRQRKKLLDNLEISGIRNGS